MSLPVNYYSMLRRCEEVSNKLHGDNKVMIYSRSLPLCTGSQLTMVIIIAVCITDIDYLLDSASILSVNDKQRVLCSYRGSCVPTTVEHINKCKNRNGNCFM